MNRVSRVGVGFERTSGSASGEGGLITESLACQDARRGRAERAQQSSDPRTQSHRINGGTSHKDQSFTGNPTPSSVHIITISQPPDRPPRTVLTTELHLHITKLLTRPHSNSNPIDNNNMAFGKVAASALVFGILYAIMFSYMCFMYATKRYKWKSRFTILFFHAAIRIASQVSLPPSTLLSFSL